MWNSPTNYVAEVKIGLWKGKKLELRRCTMLGEWFPNTSQYFRGIEGGRHRHSKKWAKKYSEIWFKTPKGISSLKKAQENYYANNREHYNTQKKEYRINNILSVGSKGFRLNKNREGSEVIVDLLKTVRKLNKLYKKEYLVCTQKVR